MKAAERSIREGRLAPSICTNKFQIHHLACGPLRARKSFVQPVTKQGTPANRRSLRLFVRPTKRPRKFDATTTVAERKRCTDSKPRSSVVTVDWTSSKQLGNDCVSSGFESTDRLAQIRIAGRFVSTTQNASPHRPHKDNSTVHSYAPGLIGVLMDRHRVYIRIVTGSLPTAAASDQ